MFIIIPYRKYDCCYDRRNVVNYDFDSIECIHDSLFMHVSYSKWTTTQSFEDQMQYITEWSVTKKIYKVKLQPIMQQKSLGYALWSYHLYFSNTNFLYYFSKR